MFSLIICPPPHPLVHSLIFYLASSIYLSSSCTANAPSLCSLSAHKSGPLSLKSAESIVLIEWNFYLVLLSQMWEGLKQYMVYMTRRIWIFWRGGGGFWEFRVVSMILPVTTVNGGRITACINLIKNPALSVKMHQLTQILAHYQLFFLLLFYRIVNYWTLIR